MSESTPGRHRASPSGRRMPPWTALVAIVAAVGAIGGAAWWMSGDSPDSSMADQSSSDPTTAPATAGPSAGSADPTQTATPEVSVQTSRTVTVDGRVVTVEERSVATGGTTRATPVPAAPPGLGLLALTTLAGDGRSTPFVKPVELSPSGSLTVRARYRLTSCPDLLPVVWPSPVEFVGSTRTYARVEEPLHTAYALCPGDDSRAKVLEGLVGTVVSDTATAAPVVRLKWQGPGSLTIAAVGSASGVAAVPVELGCDGACVAQLSNGATATLTLQPVDPCPPASTNDMLTLQRDDDEVIAVRVDGLHDPVCGP